MWHVNWIVVNITFKKDKMLSKMRTIRNNEHAMATEYKRKLVSVIKKIFVPCCILCKAHDKPYKR